MTGSNEPAREGRSEGLFDVPRFIALIPARLASTRLPDKPLADIGGKPMIVRVAEQASRSGAWKVAVATDAPSVAAAVSAAGFAVVMTRADHPSGTDRLAEAAIQLGLADDELVVNVQGDEPLIEPELIAAVARTLAGAPDCAIATAAHRIDLRDDYLNPNVVKVVLDAAGRALYFSRAPIPYDRDRLATTSNNPSVTPKAVLSDETSNPGDLLTTGLSEHDLPLRHIGIYAYRTSFLRRYPQLAESPLEVLEKLEQLRAMWHGYRIAVHQSDVASPPGVDTLADLQRVRAVLAARAVNGAPR